MWVHVGRWHLSSDAYMGHQTFFPLFMLLNHSPFDTRWHKSRPRFIDWFSCSCWCINHSEQQVITFIILRTCIQVLLYPLIPGFTYRGYIPEYWPTLANRKDLITDTSYYQSKNIPSLLHQLTSSNDDLKHMTTTTIKCQKCERYVLYRYFFK